MAIGTVAPFSAHAGSANVASLDLTIPVGAAAGDVAVALFGTNSGVATFTTPAGWTLLAGPTSNGSNNQRTVVIYRTLGAGEGGSTVTGEWSSSGRQAAAGLLLPGADTPTAAIYWSGPADSTGLSADGATGSPGGLIVALSYKLIETAGSTPTWSSSDLTEHVDIATTNGTGRRFGAWAGSVAATGSAQGPFAVTFASTGSGSGYTVVVPAAVTAPAEGSTSGSWTVSGTATGAASMSGQATGAWSVAGSAAGARASAGTAAAAWRVAGGATGASTPQGAGASSWTVTGAASGAAPALAIPTGQAAASWAVTGTASGAAPSIGVPTGSAAGTWAVHSSASGARASAGMASGQHAWASTATGAHAPAGSASGAHVWTTTAAGALTASGVAAGLWDVTTAATGQGTRPSRDITITLGDPHTHLMIVGPAVPMGFELDEPIRHPFAVGSPRR